MKRGNLCGLSVPLLSLGTSAFGDMYAKMSQQQCNSIVEHAMESGVNFFDTSPYYGITESETKIGKAVTKLELKREDFIISTKLGRYGDRHEDFDFSAARVSSSINESMKRLCVDYLDVVFVHDVEYGDVDVIANETLPELARLKESKVVGLIGISGFPLDVLKKLVEKSKTRIDVVLSYCHYTLLCGKLLKEKAWFDERGVTLINASLLHMGLLTSKDPPKWHPAPLETRLLCKQAFKACKDLGVDLSDLALKFALQSPFECHLVTVQSVNELKKNMEAAKNPNFSEKEEEALVIVKEILRPVQDKNW